VRFGYRNRLGEKTILTLGSYVGVMENLGRFIEAGLLAFRAGLEMEFL